MLRMLQWEVVGNFVMIGKNIEKLVWNYMK